jgi:glutathione S-transferase
MLKVLGKASSINVRKVLWACDETGAAYAREDVDPKAPAFLAINPNGLVPVLIDGDVCLRESNTIVRYLAGRAGRTDLLPAAPAGRARVELWMDWQATEFNAAWRYAFLGLVRKRPGHDDPAKIAASVADWSRHIAMLDAQLAATKAYVAGADFTVADIVVGLSVHRWFRTPLDHPPFPAVADYYARLAIRPAFQAHARSDTP